MRDTDHAANQTAGFLPVTGRDPASLPAIRIAGALVFAYVADGILRVSVDLDEAGPENEDARALDHYGDGLVPVLITVQGSPVYRARPGASAGPPLAFVSREADERYLRKRGG
jgi:hypothetical protein